MEEATLSIRESIMMRADADVDVGEVTDPRLNVRIITTIIGALFLLCFSLGLVVATSKQRDPGCPSCNCAGEYVRLRGKGGNKHRFWSEGTMGDVQRGIFWIGLLKCRSVSFCVGSRYWNANFRRSGRRLGAQTWAGPRSFPYNTLCVYHLFLFSLQVLLHDSSRVPWVCLHRDLHRDVPSFGECLLHGWLCSAKSGAVLSLHHTTDYLRSRVLLEQG